MWFQMKSITYIYIAFRERRLYSRSIIITFSMYPISLPAGQKELRGDYSYANE